MKRLILAGTVLLLMLNCGCQTAYYNTLEKFGIHKREILVDRVQDARNSQEDAKEQFQTALQEFTSLINYEGGELQAKYRKLNAEYEESKAKAEKVNKRIDAVRDVAEALFSEWKDELGDYSDDRLRKSSERQFEQTRGRYQELMVAMQRAAERMDPVLQAFHDQVLYLKHNLNARAIASLDQELDTIQGDIAELIEEMEQSIREADDFIRSMQ